MKSSEMRVGWRQMHTLKGQSNSVRSVAFSRDGTRVASGSFELVQIWDTATGALVSSFVAVH